MIAESKVKAINREPEQTRLQQRNMATQIEEEKRVVYVVPVPNGYVTPECIQETEILENGLLQKYLKLKSTQDEIASELELMNSVYSLDETSLQQRYQELKKRLYSAQNEFNATKELYFCVRRALNSSRFVLPEHYMNLEDCWIEAVLATLCGKHIRIKDIETSNPHLVIRCALSKILGQPQVIDDRSL
ncbi:MAG TPA: hypothetical protein VEG44_07910 [Candidatus Acidoferrales bacterium]|nr:hypothetical protein [Candidatus Acidoferrales bacterium]